MANADEPRKLRYLDVRILRLIRLLIEVRDPLEILGGSQTLKHQEQLWKNPSKF